MKKFQLVLLCLIAIVAVFWLYTMLPAGGQPTASTQMRCGNSTPKYSLSVEKANYEFDTEIKIHVADNFKQYKGNAFSALQEWFQGLCKHIIITEDAGNTEFTFEFDRLFFKRQGREIETGVVGIALMYSRSDGEFETVIKLNPYFNFEDPTALNYADINKVLLHEVGHGVGLGHHPKDCLPGNKHCGVMPNDLRCISDDKIGHCDLQRRNKLYHPPTAFCALKF